MREFRSFRSRGQTLILVALGAIALVAFVALAVDGGNAYSTRREAQSAADGAAIAGTWVMVEYQGGSPVADILRRTNSYAEANGVPDTNGSPGDVVNDNVLAYYVDADGNRLQYGGEDWELHTGPQILPGNARGIEAVCTVTRTTFFARAIGVEEVQATAHATARYEIDGGILPIAVNEYWLGSQGSCPYDNCGEPYSFVRRSDQQPPFKLVSPSPEIWERNICPDPYNEDTCQGAYEGTSENFAKAFAILGQDAKPNYGSQDPRSFVHLDYRYDAITDGNYWHYLAGDDNWMHNVKPDGKKDEMAEVIRQGGYRKVPLPRALHEPPPEYYIDGWGYCWDSPDEGNCFNYPESGRTDPYEVVEFLSGSDAAKMAKEMYDNGNYVEGRFAPGERIVIMVYNSFCGEQWGIGGNKDDTAAIVGYFGALVVGYGNNFSNCRSCAPEDWQCFAGCISGQENTVFGMTAPMAPLTIDPSKLLEEFLPKRIVLIR